VIPLGKLLLNRDGLLIHHLRYGELSTGVKPLPTTKTNQCCRGLKLSLHSAYSVEVNGAHWPLAVALAALGNDQSLIMLFSFSFFGGSDSGPGAIIAF
jgi:hypothetical protein